MRNLATVRSVMSTELKKVFGTTKNYRISETIFEESAGWVRPSRATNYTVFLPQRLFWWRWWWYCLHCLG